MKTRMSISRCCCGAGGGTPTPSCFICDLSTCGWTSDGTNEVSNTEQPQGLAHGVIFNQAFIPFNGREIWLIWDYVDSVTFNHAVISNWLNTDINFALYERGVEASSGSINAGGGTGQLDICLEFANGQQYLSVVDSVGNVSAIESTIPQGSSPKIAYRLVNGATTSTLTWTQHPDDNADCPGCGVPCPDCCDGAVSREWICNINGPLVDNYFDNCTAIDGDYVLRAPLASDGCNWEFSIFGLGEYGEGPDCLPRVAQWVFSMSLVKVGNDCQLQLGVGPIYPTDPADDCQGTAAIYRSALSPINVLCEGQHTLTLTNSPDVCFGFPATVTVRT